MMYSYKRGWLSMAAILLVCCAAAQTANKKDSASTGLKPYKDVITDKAVTDDGLFKVHRIDTRYFFEIPDGILEKDILIANRISKGKFDGGTSSYGGDMVGSSIIRFSRGPNNKFFIRERAQDMRAGDSSSLGMYRAVENTNLQPILVSFDIKAISPDGNAVVLDMTDYINGDNQLIGIDSRERGNISSGLGAYFADRSYVQSITSYPQNVEIRTVKSYVKGGMEGALGGSLGFATLELNCSILLLPEQAMKPRFNDPRIGYFLTGYYNFESDKPVDLDWMIARWRMEPKDEDIEKYKRGELVEPKKPIVYYIDPATPRIWVPYLMQGVNDWQKAFEKIGFKNAIYAKQAPADDPGWDINDARYNVIVYKSSLIPNAYGPQLIDPRSGEVLETHIGWFHNVQWLLRNWYMIQAGPNDPGGRTMDFDEALMGRLVRYVCSHEVGHTLGLQHNFISSSTVPVDSLRSKAYVRANGFCPSIMDYARFNYVAQPEDGMEREDLMPRIGAYDEWAIEFGYRWVPDMKSAAEEKEYMSKLATSRLEKDKRLWFGAQIHPLTHNTDPGRQSQDLGDNTAKAGRYAIENLKRIMPHLKEWARVENQGYENIAGMYDVLFSQYMQYLSQAYINIGGMKWTRQTVEQKGTPLSFPSRSLQKETVQFFHDEVFSARASWLVDGDLFRVLAESPNIGMSPGVMIYDYTVNQIVLNNVLNYTTYYNLMLMEALQPDSAYTLNELLTDMEKGIYKELGTKSPITEYRRGVQKSYVERLNRQLDPDRAKNFRYDQPYTGYAGNTDINLVIKAHLRQLLRKVNAAIPSYNDEITKDHLLELHDRLRKILFGKKEVEVPVAPGK